MQTDLWAQLTRDELNRTLPGALVIVPTGATEQHGPHLATGHDTLSVETIARRAAEAAPGEGRIVITPALPFGSSAHHVPFGGTLSLGTETYLRVVRDVVDSVIAAGGRRVLLLNGHGGNHELNQLVARDVVIEGRSDTPIEVSAASYWDLARDAVATDSALQGLSLPGHAGAFETALMLAIDPARVRERVQREGSPKVGRGVPGLRTEWTGQWQGFEGYTDRPQDATVALGERALAVVVQAVAEAIAGLVGTGQGST